MDAKQITKNIIRVLLCVAIISASMYPFFSDYLLQQKQQQQISKYDNKKTTSKNDYLSLFYKKATKDKTTDPFSGSDKKATKDDEVDVAKASLNTIAVLSIPKINEVLPVYDNTGTVALENGVGLLENTSPPIGGKGTHSVLTGHSGMSLDRLFTNLYKLKKNDKFYIKVNGDIHAYQVDQIKTVLPDNLKYLKVEKDKDLVTLVTCTPLFSNTHRLLVRGHRIPYKATVLPGEKGGFTPLAKSVIAGLISSSMLGFIFWLSSRKKKIPDVTVVKIVKRKRKTVVIPNHISK